MYVRHNKRKEPKVSSDSFLLILIVGAVFSCLPAAISYLIINRLTNNKAISIIISIIVEIIFVILIGS